MVGGDEKDVSFRVVFIIIAVGGISLELQKAGGLVGWIC